MDFSYLGREAFDEALGNALEHGSVILEGPRGAGKSRTLKAWEHNDAYTVLRFDLQGVTSPSELAHRMANADCLKRNRVEELFTSALGAGWKRSDPWDSLEALLSQRAPKDFLVLLDEVQLFLDEVRRIDPREARRSLLRLDKLGHHGPTVFVLTGSIALNPIATALDVSLSPAWRRIQMPGLDSASAGALFHHQARSHVAEDAMAHAAAITAGLPRWLENLAQLLPSQATALTIDDVECAVSTLLATDPFSQELHHLGRYAEPDLARTALELAAQPQANENSIRAGLAVPRRRADSVLQDLVRDFYLERDTLQHRLPLFARWLQR